MDGWNGRVCRTPAANTYCVGPYSYPGEMIAEKRDLTVETRDAGKCCSKTKAIPPCIYSANAFGPKQLTAFADPPVFFKDNTARLLWDLPPATVCVWPYEWMYGEDVVKEKGGFDHQQRLDNARSFFGQFDIGKSLIFYYSNYSSPLNQMDERRYVVVGVSRIMKIGDIRYFEGCSDKVRERYAGGYVWQCDVTSQYPDEGLRLPYHLYLDKPDILDQFAFFPENPRNFKYGTREITDDDALDLVERFLECAGALQELGDRSEDWTGRIRWLQRLVGELWENRGLYPGMSQVLQLLGFEDAIPYWKDRVLQGKEQETIEHLFAFLEGKVKKVKGLAIDEKQTKSVLRQWKLREDDERRLLREVFPRFDLTADQFERILGSERAQNGILCGLEEIAENPYLISEEFIGDGPDDQISFSKIDHGVFPSPDLGGDSLCDTDDWRRLRGLCVDRFRRESRHTFLPASILIHDVNHKLSFLPDWKKHQFTEKYLTVDEEDLEGALVFRELDGVRYVYRKLVHEDEREIERWIRKLATRPDITLRSAVTATSWQSYLTDGDSILARKAPKEYKSAIGGQVAVCQRVFLRPVSVICGAAGTGKTRVIDAIIKAIEKAHGTGTSFQLLAPTGKAADRIREMTGKQASTIHSFLARLGWMNPNMTFKRSGGQKEDKVQTYIIDEASMLDLELAAALFRAINWPSVQRLIFVGDPNQLPPIGVGKVFADVIDWMREEQPECIAELQTNIRQMENRVSGRGRSILALAELYVRRSLGEDSEDGKAGAEDMLQKVQEGGEIDEDLRVVYWDDADHLAKEVEARIIADIEEDSGQTFDQEKPYESWNAACEAGQGRRAEYLQILSPYRGELFGTDHINTVIQRLLQPYARRSPGELQRSLNGIMLFDKVIQIRNRPKSDQAWGYNLDTKKVEPVEVYNGELGFVRPHGFDCSKLKYANFRLRRFQVAFARKENIWVGYGEELGQKASGGWIPKQPVEENLELAYAISVHKAQGSEFERVYFIVPKHKVALLSPEMFYTGMTRARRHCTLFVEEDISPLLSMRRRERSHLLGINSSLFDFEPVPVDLLSMGGWYEEGKVHQALAGFMVRSKSEVIIANMLSEREIPFQYETKLSAPDGTFFLPDFTIMWNGERWFWEHWGRMDREEYRKHRETKVKWYGKHFPGRLVETFEGPTLSADADALIEGHFL